MPSQPIKPVIVLLASAACFAASLSAQRVRAEAPVALAIPVAPGQGPQGGAASPDDDPGTSVDLFENPNLDRYLRKAQSFFTREDFSGAIELLQQVIEGRTSEVIATGPEETGTGEAAKPTEPEPDKDKKDDAEQQKQKQLEQLMAARRGGELPKPGPREAAPDARNAVFSQDGRLYRPVRRLCHEMLARMPTVGVEIYRATYEVAAEELLQQALAEGSVPALEQVANRYFVTAPAGKAMALLADRLMHEGRYRAAVLVLSDLLETYPADLRKRLAISDVWCRFKIALCLRLAGEQAAAHDAVQALATAFPDESLRVLGQLHSMRDLPTDALFVRDVATIAPHAHSIGSWLADPANDLVPLWQFRFRNPEPYKDPKTSSDRNQVMFFDGVTTATMPHAGRYGPATWISFARDPLDPAAPPKAHFLEHYCLRTTDATTGVLLQAGDGSEEPPVAREGHPRVRVAASDFALLRPVDDGERRYVVLGHPRGSTSSVEALKVSTLTAYDAKAGTRVWDSTAWTEGDGGLREVTFLAAPTVFGEKLMLPALRRGRYSLECLDRATGRPLWNTPLHAGGTPFFKAPGCPVVVQSGVAFVATNAGCVAAVDAFTGDMRWIRRYERVDPRRKSKKAKKPVNNDMGWGRPQFGNEELTTFLPNDMQVLDGLVIVAPVDGDMLLCLDGATGQPHWMLDGTSIYAPYGKLRSLVGRIGDDMFLMSDTHLVGVGASGGLIKWARELPTWNGPKNTGRGRGAVAGDCVVIPGERELLVYGIDGKLVRKVPLPAFDPSRDPLLGSANVIVDGPWLAVGYQGGVEVFSSRVAISQVAATVADPVRKADLQLRSGDADAAIGGLAAALRAATLPEQKLSLGRSLLALTRERAIALAKPGDATAALALLDTVFDLLVDRTVRINWHLARVEICKDHGDLRAHEREQNRLYDYMEGRQ